jgi:hypothetical protein
MSVQTTLTVGTTRTAANENENETKNNTNGTSDRKTSQVCVHPAHPVADLEKAQSDIAALSICFKEIDINRPVASAFLQLLRGDNRSWEAIAVDILRQKARWENITLEDCDGESMDLLISFILNLDQCAFVHMSNLVLSPHSAWSLQSLSFTKSLQKLQLDLIDLGSFAVPSLCKGLQENTSLTCLIASRCGLGDKQVKELVSRLPKQLEELRIFGNKCRSQGLEALTELLQTSTHLKILDLSYQHVQENEHADFDVSWLAGALIKNKTLKVLDLDNDSIDDGHLTHLCAALCKNSTLEELMLNHNHISAAGIALLASKFGDMKGLKKISMFSNLFDAPGAPAAAAPATAAPATAAPATAAPATAAPATAAPAAAVATSNGDEENNKVAVASPQQAEKAVATTNGDVAAAPPMNVETPIKEEAESEEGTQED